MAKGGNSQRSNCSRFSKPYNVSNNFVTKVASRVTDYLGGWFGTPSKSSSDAEGTGTSTIAASGDTTNRRIFESFDVNRPSVLSHRFLDVEEVDRTPAKRFKISEAEKVDIDFPITPIPSTSGLFQSSTVKNTYNISKSEEFAASEPRSSNLQSQRYSQTNNVAGSISSLAADSKANGTADNHSDSSESTSGCSSLVPQSDRLSQSAYACTSRKRNLEEKLKYARQLQQSRASVFLNRSIPVSETSGARKKPSFDVTAYGSLSMDKSLLREKLINSPFYTGQTSYGGASAYRLSRNTFYSQRNPRGTMERREGTPVEVRPAHQGSTETMSNMSHTAKKILEALEQFSTPVSDAKRIPVNRMTPLGMKRRRFDELSDTKMRLSTPISPLNPNPAPVITGLNVPTVPDLLKLKRLERIQNSTAAARQVAVPKQEYTLPSDIPPTKLSGKIVTKLKDKEKNVNFEKLEEVNLPKIPLPITTLPKFDFKLPPMHQPTAPTKKLDETSTPKRSFKFSDPIPVSMSALSSNAPRKNSFTFSKPLNAGTKNEAQNDVPSSLTSFMSSDAIAKLKRKSVGDSSSKTNTGTVPSVAVELKTGSVMQFFNKLKESTENKSPAKLASETWECGSCMIRNLNDSKICCACKAEKANNESQRTLPNPPKAITVPEQPKPLPTTGFGNKFKPPAGSWSCKECFIVNKESSEKCAACEAPNPTAKPKVASPPQTQVAPKPMSTGFGEILKKQASQWECPTCMIRNKESDMKCVACETAKPGSKPEKLETKFNFGIPATSSGGTGFVFGIDKAAGVKSAADSSTFKIQSNGIQSDSGATNTGFSQFKPISTSVGVFTFGIPPTASQEKKETPSKSEENAADASNSMFMVTSTSGSNRKDDVSRKELPSSEKPEDGKDKPAEVKTDKNEVSVTDSSKSFSEGFKPSMLDSSKKFPTTSIFGNGNQEKSDAKAPNFHFGANSNSLEAVSSSTTDFSLRQNKPSTMQLGVSDSGMPKPSMPFQFKPFGTPEPAKTNASMTVEANEAEVKPSCVSTTNTVTTSASVFESGSLFNAAPPKMTFGMTSASSTNLGFMDRTMPSNPSPFSTPVQSFGTPSFNSQPLTSPVVSAAPFSSPVLTPAPAPASVSMPMPTPTNTLTFGAPSSAAPAMEQSSSTFGGPASTFGGVSNPFASNIVPSANPEAPKGFGGLGTNTGVPAFGTNPAPAFGSVANQPSLGADKSTKPFIFGSSTPSTTINSTPSLTAPGVFTFGASKPTQAQFTFGQNNVSNNAFGSNTPSMNIFGNFGQPKNDVTVGASTSTFGNAASSIFGQNSAPAAFESSAPKFEFGGSTAPQQTPSNPVFQFGASPAMPSTAPASTGLSLSVPPTFNFTGGQQANVSSAEPKSEAEPSKEENLHRRFIKAVRRTNPRRGN